MTISEQRTAHAGKRGTGRPTCSRDPVSAEYLTSYGIEQSAG
jgi:hypothetical protein